MIGNKGAIDLGISGDQRNKEVVITSSATVTAYSLSLQEQVARLVLTNGNNLTITLPSVAAAAGRTYVIQVITDGGASATVQDLNGDAALSDITLADDEDGVVLFSCGRSWWVLGTIGLTATDYD